MANGDETSLRLSREDLFELVWSKPMLELAKDFGISDVALAKRCKRLGIPVPGRGYWARVDAGQTPYRPNLPKRELQWGDHRALTLGASSPEGADREKSQANAEGQSVNALRARISTLSVTPVHSVLDSLAAVKRTARLLKHPSRSGLSFARGEKSGPVVSMSVTDATLDRACLFADAILRSCESLGWTFTEMLQKEPDLSPGNYADRVPETQNTASRTPPIGQLLVEGERITFRIEERMRVEDREPTAVELAREKREYGYKARRKMQVPTGTLRVRLDTHRVYGASSQVTWYDRKSTRVEEQVADILVGFYELSLSIKARRAEDERQERDRQEAERRREEREARQEENANLIKQLETDAGAWHRARYLRRYIQAARRALGSDSLRVRFRDQGIDYLQWAEEYVNQLDPLHPSPRSVDFESRPRYFMNDQDRMKELFGRLLGGEWEAAWKLGNDYSPDPNERNSHRQKSVFEVD